MQSDNVVVYSNIYLQYFILLRKRGAEDESIRTVSLCQDAKMFLSTDSDRDEPPSMLCKSASRDGSIPSGIDLFNSDLAGMPLSLLCYSLLYIQYICNNVAIVFNYLSINDNHCVAFTFYYIIFKYYSHVFTSLPTSGL